MNKRELIERWICYSASQHRKKTWAKPQRWNTPIQLNTFAKFISSLVKKQPIVEEYINTIYAEWKDIMYLYRLYQTSRLHWFDKTKTFADYMFATRDNINAVSSSAHISLYNIWTGIKDDCAI